MNQFSLRSSCQGFVIEVAGGLTPPAVSRFGTGPPTLSLLRSTASGSRTALQACPLPPSSAGTLMSRQQPVARELTSVTLQPPATSSTGSSSAGPKAGSEPE